MKRIIFLLDETIQVFRLGKTSNAKISKGGEQIIQTYTFSIDQFNFIRGCILTGQKPTIKSFFGLDAKNCFDCPFSVANGNGGCYTHKGMLYFGLISMLKSIVREFDHIDNIPTYNDEIGADIVQMSIGKYVRFGSYGEPSMHPLELVKLLTKASKSWTGYTHQYFRKPEYAEFLMASVHNARQAKTAADKFGYRSFVAASDVLGLNNMVQCPASKEAGYKSNCADCGLCSGTTGKGKKSIKILEH